MRRGDSSDNGRSYFRSGNRIFNQNGAWYFGTREGDQGPFVRRELVVQAVETYAGDRISLEKFQKQRESVMSIRADKLTLAIVPKDEPATANVGIRAVRPFVDTAVRGNLALEIEPELEN